MAASIAARCFVTSRVVGSLYVVFPRLGSITQVRYRQRYLNRKPIEIHTREEAENIQKASRKRRGISRQDVNSGVNDISDPIPRLSITTDPHVSSSNEIAFQKKSLDSLQYENLEEGDRRFGPVMAISKSRKLREKKQKVLLEGKRLIRDALLAGATMESLFFSRLENLEDFPLELLQGAPLYKVGYKHMSLWSDVSTSPGLMAIFRMPRQEDAMYERESWFPITLICDNIRDPGNMGTVIRSAAAVGCHKVLISKGCVDVWEPKVLRSAAGAHFRIPLIPNLDWELISNYLRPDSNVYLADNSAQMPQEKKIGKKLLLRLQSVSSANSAENSDDDHFPNESSLDKETVNLYKDAPLPVKGYFETNFTDGESVLVVGGETEGLSAEAHKMAFDRFGQKVFVPMLHNVESLNSAVASSVILFEIKRQLITAGVCGERGVIQ